MNNPFIFQGATLNNSSINRVKVRSIPKMLNELDIVDHLAIDLFSPQLIIIEMMLNKDILQIPIDMYNSKHLPKYLAQCLESRDDNIKNCAHQIVKKYAKRLAIIILTLKKGNVNDRLLREDWNDSHWDYWSTINHFILVGGLASEHLGVHFKKYIEDYLVKWNEPIFQITIPKDTKNLALRGCMTLINKPMDIKRYLVFDFGQSFVKRGIGYRDEQGEHLEVLEDLPSQHVKFIDITTDEELALALKLNQLIVNTIVSTWNEITQEKGTEIVISFANYVTKDGLSPIAAYGKLNKIDINYRLYLEHTISKQLNQTITIHFVHDGTAMALNFKNIENSACISLGTAFGIGFPRK